MARLGAIPHTQKRNCFPAFPFVKPGGLVPDPADQAGLSSALPRARHEGRRLDGVSSPPPCGTATRTGRGSGEELAPDALVGCVSLVGHRIRLGAPALSWPTHGRCGHRALAGLLAAGVRRPRGGLRRVAAPGPAAVPRRGVVAAAPHSRFPPTRPHPWSACAQRTVTPRRPRSPSSPQPPTLGRRVPSARPTACGPRVASRAALRPTLPVPSLTRGIRPWATRVTQEDPYR